MPKELIQIFEITFDLAYLAIIWTLVVLLFKNRYPQGDLVSRLSSWGFFLLALGDTGHVGFRAAAYLSGSLETTITLLGKDLSLIGLGSLATAYTVTVLYMIFTELYYRKQDRPKDLLYWGLHGLAIFRLIIMVFPQNLWFSHETPYAWSMLRNIPLMLQGLTLGYLYFKAKDKLFHRLGIYIFISYAFYMPVIFFVRWVPMIGMLMIPKTIAYLFMAFAIYKSTGEYTK